MEEIIKQLTDLNCTDIKRFSFKGIDTPARVSSIYDPDTITIVFPMLGKFIKLKVRLSGIDAPELKSKIKAESDVCKKGIEQMNKLIGDKVIRVQLDDFDKYGRVLARVYTLDENPICINDYLIEYQYVRKYDGGKKEEWTQNQLDACGTKL